jgi:hypothetical protein
MAGFALGDMLSSLMSISSMLVGILDERWAVLSTFAFLVPSLFLSGGKQIRYLESYVSS